VRINKQVSDWLELTGEMPQGTGLGSLSFVVYIKGNTHAKEIVSD